MVGLEIFFLLIQKVVYSVLLGLLKIPGHKRKSLMFE